MHESRLDQEDLNLSGASRYPYGLFLLLSFLLHLTMFLLVRSWDFTKAPVKEKPDEFIQLVDPPPLPAPPPKRPGDLLFGTDRPADLESIPKGKETRLPPIPKSTEPTGRPRSGRPGSAPPAESIRPPAPSGREGIAKREAPSVPIVPPPTESRPQPAPIPLPAPSPDAPAAPDQHAVQTPAPDLPMNPSAPPPVTPSLPRSEGERRGGAGEESLPGAPSRPGGLPGLPFADSKSLDRLAKVFSDREPAAPKDAVSINTEELKYFSYLMKVKSRIEYIWKYPAAAAERQMEGDLFLTFTIHRDGKVTDVSVASTSGYELLDQEAVRAITAASPFAPLPDAWNEDHITITGHFLYMNRSNYIR